MFFNFRDTLLFVPEYRSSCCGYYARGVGCVGILIALREQLNKCLPGQCIEGELAVGKA